MATKATKNTVGLKELRENMETYIKRVQDGDSLTVFRRSTPLFKISPIDDDEESGWETVIDFTKEFGEGVPIEELMTSIKKIDGQK